MHLFELHEEYIEIIGLMRYCAVYHGVLLNRHGDRGRIWMLLYVIDGLSTALSVFQ